MPVSCCANFWLQPGLHKSCVARRKRLWIADFNSLFIERIFWKYSWLPVYELTFSDMSWERMLFLISCFLPLNNFYFKENHLQDVIWVPHVCCEHTNDILCCVYRFCINKYPPSVGMLACSSYAGFMLPSRMSSYDYFNDKLISVNSVDCNVLVCFTVTQYVSSALSETTTEQA